MLRQYRRLVEQSDGLIDWHFVLNSGKEPDPIWRVVSPRSEHVLPLRHARMMENGGVLGGFLDTVVFPCILALNRPFVWIMEYDVDFSGTWSDFFGQFRDENTDLLTTTLTSRNDSEDWDWWRTARAPGHVPTRSWFRGFHPIMRVSNLMARIYQKEMRDAAWAGHFEFTLPTVAAATGCSLGDLKEKRNGRGSNYRNNPDSELLIPGTFVWRPSRNAYFHEEPCGFEESDMLYHPIKTDAVDWNAR